MPPVPRESELPQLLGEPGPRAATRRPGQDGFLGEQIRGFGYGPQAHVDTIVRIASDIDFSRIFPAKPNPEGIPPGPVGLPERIAAAKFLLAFDSNLAPIVGQQVTLSASNAATATPRIALLEQRAAAGECDLVVKGVASGRERGWLYIGAQRRSTHIGRCTERPGHAECA